MLEMQGNAMTPYSRPTAGRPITLEAIERSVARPVLITSRGSDRDVDIVCRSPERAALQELLTTSGYLPRGRRLGGRPWTEQWVRFHGAGTHIVDLNPAERWGVAADAFEHLFDEAPALDEYRRIRRPSPHHGLILMARRFGRGAGPLSAKQRSKLDAIVAGDAQAWERASAIARDWHCRAAVAGLRRRHLGATPGRALRMRAALEPVLKGQHRLGRFAVAVRSLPVPRRPFVVSLSGVDGSGKSTQVAALRETLGDLGVATELGWRPVGHGIGVRLVRRSVKRLAGDRPARGPGKPPAEAAPALGWDPNPVSRRLRERSAALTAAWAAYVAVSTAATYRRAELRCRVSRKALICDRSALDTAAHLVFQYGKRRRPTLAIRLADLITPRPDVAFHLDVPVDVARSRKPLQYTAEQLERLSDLYACERARLGIARLDGTCPPDQLAETIARGAWIGAHVR
jgi:thymidylate kinase